MGFGGQMNNLCSLVSAKVPRMIYTNEEAMEHHCLFPLILLLGLLLRIFLMVLMRIIYLKTKQELQLNIQGNGHSR